MPPLVMEMHAAPSLTLPPADYNAMKLRIPGTAMFDAGRPQRIPAAEPLRPLLDREPRGGAGWLRTQGRSRGRCSARRAILQCGILLAMDSKQLLAEALQLPPEERAALAGELIQSLDSEVDEDAEAAWSAEVRRRIERLDAGLASTVPWAEARRRILAATRRDSKA